MSKIFLATTFTAFFCAALAAQAPQAQDPSAPPRVAPPAAGAGSPGAPPQSQSRSAPKADAITVEGCIQRGTSGSPTAGTTGTTGSAAATAFMLMSATKPAGSTATTPIASSYRLDADASKLTPHVGHKVEITGTLAPPEGGSAAMSSPKLKVENVKMIAASCTN
jgi:hypothetical protein